MEDGDWHIRICVQYDEYLEPVLSSETAAMQKLVKMRTGHKGCGRCIDGKCAFTGFDLVNPTEEQLGLAKKHFCHIEPKIDRFRQRNLSISFLTAGAVPFRNW